MKKLRSIELRQMWIDFFKAKNHFHVSSASLIPLDDESLLWINSGVSTLKKYFEGKKVPPSKRLVNYQKSVRTNDIDNVGITSRHHTFFEMLGNFSIGDYFIEEAIDYAYEFLFSNKYLGIDLEKIYITVFEEDEQTYQKWIKKGIKEDHIFKMSKKTNFWDIGVGPCGPNTEIFYDRGEKYDKRGPKELIFNDIENNRFLEIWNIVLSKYNNDGNKNYSELPQKNIDTGLGLERLVCISQDKPSNFETDLFWPIIEKIESYSKLKYITEYINQEELSKTQQNINYLYKSSADFIRAIILMISDGAKPSNNGRGYIIRRLLRRVIINFNDLNIEQNISIVNFIDVVENIFKDVYLEISKNKKITSKIIKQEEKLFKDTLQKSLLIFESEYKNNLISENEIDSLFLFKLFETYGLPLELIETKLKKLNLSFDLKKYNEAFEDFKLLSKKMAKENNALEKQQDIFLNVEKTKFEGYEKLELDSKLIAKTNDDDFIYLAFENSPFYVESGGQVNDSGLISGIKVLDLKSNLNGVIIHVIDNTPENDQKFILNNIYQMSVDKEKRKLTAINHSSTHLLFAALEKILNYDLPQQGSKVTPEELRFDFLSFDKISLEQIQKAEEMVNIWISQSIASNIYFTSQEEAKQNGAKFLDNVKYGKNVRVVDFPTICIDLCGGTHIKNTSEIEKIKVVGFETKGSGIYRITAITTNNTIVNYEKNKLELNKQKNDLMLQTAIKSFDSIKSELLNISNIKIEEEFKFDLDLNTNFDVFQQKLKKAIEEFENTIFNYIKTFLLKSETIINLNNLNKKTFAMFSKQALKNLETKLIINNEEEFSTITIILNNEDSKKVLINEIKKSFDIKGGGSKSYYQFKGLNKEINLFLQKIWKELSQ